MSILHPLVRGLDRRLLILLRVPVQDLAVVLPGTLTPWVRRGMGLVLLDYGHMPPPELGPLELGRGTSQLAVRIPVRPGPDADGATRLWTPGRWRDGGLTWRWLPRRAVRPASFRFHTESLAVELEVRTPEAPTLYLRGHQAPRLRGSLFATLHEAEVELDRFGSAGAINLKSVLIGRSTFAVGGWTEPLENLALERQGLGLEPLAVDALKSAALPVLLPGLEDVIELDSAFSVVRRRRVASLAPLSKLSARPRRLGLPPGSAMVRSGMTNS